MQYNIFNNQDKSRFEAVIENEVIGLVDYNLSEDNKTIIIPHTEVNPEFEGKGIAGALTKCALEYAKENKLKVIPICPYTETYIERHSEYRDLLKQGE